MYGQLTLSSRKYKIIVISRNKNFVQKAPKGRCKKKFSSFSHYYVFLPLI